MKRSAEEPRAGSVRLEGDVVRFTRRGAVEWSVDLNELALLGELATDRGPYADDLVVIFVVRDGRWFELPFDADGADELLVELARRLDVDTKLQLCNRVDWVSRVLWPRELAGAPLFDFPPAPRNSGWFRGLLDRAVPRFTIELTCEARARCSGKTA